MDLQPHSGLPATFGSIFQNLSFGKKQKVHRASNIMKGLHCVNHVQKCSEENNFSDRKIPVHLTALLNITV